MSKAKTAMAASALLILSALMSAQSPSPKATADQILHTSGLWGKDFSLALSQISSWHAVGEGQVEVVSNRVIGLKSYSKPDSERVVSRLNQELHAHQTGALKAVDEWLHNNGSVRTEGDFRQMTHLEKAMESPTGTPESGVRVQVAHADQLQFLNPRLTAEDLKKELGLPDKVSYKKRDLTDGGKYEGRPEIIKVYSYADGAVQFEESNLSPYVPGKDGRLIQKAVIDTTHVEDVLPQAAK